MNERHAMYRRRFLERRDPPWTKDPILSQFKFTNVFRELDAVTIALHQRVDKLKPGPDKLFDIIAFRAFNWPETYDTLLPLLGRNGFNVEYAKLLLTNRKKEGHKIFTGAYIVTAAGQSRPKIDMMCEALGQIHKIRDRLWKSIEAVKTMEGATRLLAAQPMHGNFTAYEVICDLRHQRGMFMENAPDKMTWANLGPGAKRGVCRLLNKGPKRPKPPWKVRDYVKFMAELCAAAPHCLDKKIFKGAQKIECREIEHSLCEMDKYLRASRGEGKLRSRYP